ncbi:hypothetical protein NQ314_013528 [Rhamnusium bicolor]|uniref:ATP synthase subunit b n=1 Tax=Rhamnusium bicolor TaxID=1586634 RepID=A0AAV8X6E5_9CUCU|nr:hypothetical protein NQ314_013528 [Rhamnusium bicolor]
MFQPKYLQLLRHIPKYIYVNNTIFGKAYYSETKKTIVVVDPTQDLKKVKCIPVSETFKGKTADEIENITFENEDEIMQTVMTEKEKDASVRSRLSKECNELFKNKRITLCSSGLSVHLEPHGLKKSSWEDYTFDKTIMTLKKQQSAPITDKAMECAGGSSSGSSNRIIRGEPGKVIWAFIPEEWITFFIPKTGVSGFGTFLFTFGIFLISKEYYVLEHNYYNGLSMIIVCWAGVTYGGPLLAKELDKQVDEYEQNWQKGRIDAKMTLEEEIGDEHLLQMQADGQLMLVEAKRENVAMQLEEEFRKRQMQVYNEVKERLEYHVAVAMVHRKIYHKNLVQYVTSEVQKSITPEMQQQLINVSLESIVSELEKDDKGPDI